MNGAKDSTTEGDWRNISISQCEVYDECIVKSVALFLENTPNRVPGWIYPETQGKDDHKVPIEEYKKLC